MHQSGSCAAGSSGARTHTRPTPASTVQMCPTSRVPVPLLQSCAAGSSWDRAAMMYHPHCFAPQAHLAIAQPTFLATHPSSSAQPVTIVLTTSRLAQVGAAWLAILGPTPTVADRRRPWPVDARHSSPRSSAAGGFCCFYGGASYPRPTRHARSFSPTAYLRPLAVDHSLA